MATEDKRALHSAEGHGRGEPALLLSLDHSLEEIREPGFEMKIHQAGSLPLSHLGSPSDVSSCYEKKERDFPGSQVFKTLPSSAKCVGLISGLGAKILHASQPKSKKTHDKSNIVTK